jgi:hypothetical protein
VSYIKNYGNLYAQTFSYSNGESIFQNISSNSLSIAGNVSAGNVIAVGNVSGNYILGNGAFLTGLPQAYSNANVANYLPTYTGNLNPGNLAITGGQANLGPAANVKISGGTLNYYLTSDGAGGLAWAAGTGNITGNGTVAGSDQQIQFNNGTANFAASAALRFDYTANILRVTGAANVTGNIDATGNISGAYFLGNGAFLSGLNFTNYSNANVAAYLPNYQGLISNIEFRSTSPAAAAIIVNDRSLTIGGNLYSYIILPNDANANSVAAELTNHGLGNVLISSGPADYEWVFDYSGNLTTPGNIAAGNAISANYFLGNGAFLTGLPSGLSNADVANYLASNAAVTILTTGNITTAANISGNYILGNGALLTGIAAGYSNANVDNYLASNAAVTILTTSNITSAANIAGSYILGNGAFLTGLNFTNYSNANVANYLASNAAVTILTTSNITSAANVSGSYILGNGAFLTGISGTYSNADVANYLPTYTGAIDSLTGNVTTTANVQGAYLLGNGAFITGLPAGLSNADVANYLASNAAVTILTTGNVTTTANLQGDYVLGNGAFLTGIATSSYSNANVANYLASNANVTVSIGTGNITTQGNIRSRALYVGSQETVAYQVPGNVTLAGGALDNNANISIIANGTMTTSYVLSLPAGTPNAGEVLSVKNFGSYSGVGQVANLVWTAPSGGSYGNSNVADYLQVYNGNALFSNVTVSRDAVILGNLRVEGNTTYINVTDLVIEDKDIIVAANANATMSDLDGAGLQIGNISSGGNITFFYDSASNIMALSHGLSIANTLFVEGNIEATGNVLAEYVDANYFVGNGALLTGLNFTNYSNANVANYLASNANVTITTIGNITTTANIAGSYIFGNGAFLTGISGGGANLGNAIDLGTPTQGNLTSNAVTLTTTTTVTDGVALLNEVLGKLVPPRPSNFPAGQTLTVTTAGTSARMTNYVQPDNTPGANKSVAAGTLVTAIRSSTYTTNTITNAGPGDTGTLLAVLNGANAGSATFNAAASPNVNGTYSNLVITNNYDFNQANSSITAGFWYVFSSRATGTVPTGWNEVYIRQTAVGNSAAPYWFYDSAAPGTPAYSNVSVTACATPTLAYTSTIPHYASGTTFDFGFSVNRLSGNTYPNSNNLSTGSAAGAFQAPATVTYAAAGVTEPLAQNLYVASGTVTANTTAGIVTTGFGSSATGPSVTVNNSYNSAAQAFTTALAATVLFKNGNSTAIDEGNITVTSVGTGSGNAFRIINPGSGNTPAYTANATAFNSQSSTLQTYDAVVAGSGSQGVMSHNQTNYSTGFLPAGPDLSAGRSGTQYFTFKFIRTGVSKFDIRYTGTVAGMWVALPGSVIDTSSSINGWMDMTQAYAGSGYPGVNVPGNGSDGCSLGGTVAVNTAVTNASKTCTFGTVSSSSTATNEIYIRIALTSGQSVTALTIIAATN